MNDRYWKEKYADYHSRSESRIAELEKENAELKKAVETLAKGLCIRQDKLEELLECQK